MSLLDFIHHADRLAQEIGKHRAVPHPPTFTPFQGGGKNRSSRRFLSAVFVFVAVFFCAQAALADEALLKGPGKAIRTTVRAKEPATGKADMMEKIASAPVRFYQHFLSHQWGQTCAYYPSCSNYALLAIRKHGALVGSIMTFDRLQHEADEARTSPPIMTNGQIKLYDPLENNDYWWYTTPHSKPAPPVNAR